MNETSELVEWIRWSIPIVISTIALVVTLVRTASRPDVIAYVELGDKVPHLFIENVGQRPAFDVRFESDRPIRALNPMKGSKVELVDVPYLPPGQRRHVCWWGVGDTPRVPVTAITARWRKRRGGLRQAKATSLIETESMKELLMSRHSADVRQMIALEKMAEIYGNTRPATRLRDNLETSAPVGSGADE